MKLREKLVSLSLRFVPPNKEINYFRLNKPWTDKFLHALLVAFSTFEKPRVNLLPEEEQGLSKLLGLSQEVFSRTGWIHLVVEEDSVPSSVRPPRGDVTMKWCPHVFTSIRCVTHGCISSIQGWKTLSRVLLSLGGIHSTLGLLTFALVRRAASAQAQMVLHISRALGTHMKLEPQETEVWKHFLLHSLRDFAITTGVC